MHAHRRSHRRSPRRNLVFAAAKTVESSHLHGLETGGVQRKLRVDARVSALRVGGDYKGRCPPVVARSKLQFRGGEK